MGNGIFENIDYIVSGYKNKKKEQYYSIVWLDTGAKTMGFLTKSEARKNGDKICAKRDPRLYLSLIQKKECKKNWKKLGEIPINSDEEIELDFLHFTKGTNREEIWLWFEEYYNISVVDLMFPK